MERTYMPGVCNLSDAEAMRRNIGGWVGLIVTIALEIYFLSAQTLPAIRLVVFFPLTFGALGFLQGIMHFCVSFGMSGVFNVRNQVGKTETVTDTAHRAQDRSKAERIIFYSVLIGLVGAVLAYIL